MPPLSLLTCWSVSYQREKIFPFLVVSYNFTFSLPWRSQIIILWQWWLMISMWPSANPFYMAAKYPPSHCCSLYLQLCKWSCPDHPDGPSLLLWTQWNQPLLLCGPSSSSPGLLRYLCQRDCYVCEGWFQPHVFSHHHPHLLHFHLHNHSVYPFWRRRLKAFSTCGSHLTAVIIFYGTLFCMHLRSPF